jgi:mRNA interferase MazF
MVNAPAIVGVIVPDQLRTVDREWLVKRLGVLPESTQQEVLAVLQEMFAV